MELSKQETKVIKLIAQGYTSEEIASKLFVQKCTIDTHRKNINKKLKPFGVKNLTIYAVKNYLERL